MTAAGSVGGSPDSAERADSLDRFGVPAARLNDVAGLVEHPQLEARNRWRGVGTPAGPVRGLLPAMTFSGLEPPMGRVPARGGHTEAILVERAGALDEGDT
ncbi:CoA transferase [Dietzia cinnamea]|uniref:CoA transferase n=1 Tax=Dietzia cinnamea TaxID=321318 RepID=UPI003F6A40ED